MPNQPWLDELVSELGEPESVTRGGCMVAARWLIEDQGNAGRGGLLLARSATPDTTSLLAQAQQLRAAAAASGLAPRQLVVATGSGTAPAAQRPDLALALEAIHESWCTFVAAARLDRFARSLATLQLLLDESAKAGVELLSMDFGRLQALERAEMTALVWRVTIEEAEWRRIVERTRQGRLRSAAAS